MNACWFYKPHNLRVYEGEIGTVLPANGIFVYGGNTEGRPGMGAALIAATYYGAVRGHIMGRCGKSYCLVTKDLQKPRYSPSVSKEYICIQIAALYAYALDNNELDFYVAYGVGPNLNNYTPQEMADMFSTFRIPPNIIFNSEFYKLLTRKEILPSEAFVDLLTGVDEGSINEHFFSFYMQDYHNHNKNGKKNNEGIGKEYLSIIDKELNSEGYYYYRNIPGKNICALSRMAYTVGLFVDVEFTGSYKYRYCYPTLRDAWFALKAWDGTGHPPGEWIKRKGEGGDLRNPNYPDPYDQTPTESQ